MRQRKSESGPFRDFLGSEKGLEYSLTNTSWDSGATVGERDADSSFGFIKIVLDIDRHSFSAPWTYNFFQSALKNIFLVLEKEREVIGYLIACVCHDLEKAVILRIALHPDHRGEGAARTLMRTCLDMLVEKDIGVVELDVELVSLGAIKLYEKFGFKIADILVFPSDFPGDEETFYIMRLELP